MVFRSFPDYTSSLLRNGSERVRVMTPCRWRLISTPNQFPPLDDSLPILRAWVDPSRNLEEHLRDLTQCSM